VTWTCVPDCLCASRTALLPLPFLASSVRMLPRSASLVRCALAAPARRWHPRALCTGLATRLINRAREQLAPGKKRASPPRPQEVTAAVEAVAKQRNGYLAWSLYVALKQGDVAMVLGDLEKLTGTMLHVDMEAHAEMAAQRALSVVDAERQAGRQPSPRLLAHGAAASALQGLPDLAEALCDEADARAAGDAPKQLTYEMRASLIAACGVAKQLPRAFAEYHSFAARVHRAGDGPHDLRFPQPSLALLSACVAARDLDAAFTLLEELRTSKRFSIRAGALVPLLRGCARHDDISRAREVLEMARDRQIELRAAAVREFARHGGADFVALARDLHRTASRDGALMPTGSTTKLVRACLESGDTSAAAEVLALPSRGADSTSAELDSALDLVQSLARQELQRERAAQDVRQRQRRAEPAEWWEY